MLLPLLVQEVAPYGWEGTLVNTMASSSKFATIVGNLVVILLEATLTHDQLYLWGWRIPFLSAILTGGVVSYAEAAQVAHPRASN